MPGASGGCCNTGLHQQGQTQARTPATLYADRLRPIWEPKMPGTTDGVHVKQEQTSLSA